VICNLETERKTHKETEYSVFSKRLLPLFAFPFSQPHALSFDNKFAKFVAAAATENSGPRLTGRDRLALREYSSWHVAF